MIALIFIIGAAPPSAAAKATAPKASVRVPKGPFQANIDLQIVTILNPGTRIRVILPDAAWKVTLFTPDGERISEPLILTRTFAVESPPLVSNVAPAPGRTLAFRAVRALPPGRYRVHLEGNATRRARAHAEFIPRSFQDAPGSDSSCCFLGLGKADIPGLIVTSPIWAPLLTFWIVNSVLDERANARAVRRQIPSHVVVRPTPLRIPGVYDSKSAVLVGHIIEIKGWVINGKVRRFSRLELRAAHTPPEPPQDGGSATAAGPAEVLTDIPPVRWGDVGIRGYFRPTLPGTYRFQVRAEGENAQGKPFSVEGTSQELVRVITPAVEFLSMEDALIDANGNGLPEAWRIRARVQVYTPGLYQAALSPAGKLVSSACSIQREISLDAGERIVDFLVSPDKVRACYSIDPRATLPRIDLDALPPRRDSVVWRFPRLYDVPGGAPPLRQFHFISWETDPISSTGN